MKAIFSNTFRVLAIVAMAVPGAALAADVVVVEAFGVALRPGQVLDGAQPLALVAGQRVTLVVSDGRVIKLQGPTASPPAPDIEPPKGAVAKSLKDLISSRETDVSSLGVVRSGETRIDLPEPWLLDIRHSGNRCLEEGALPVLWRGADMVARAEIVVAPADDSWNARAVWPEGADRLELPASLSLQDRHVYTMTLDGGAVQVTVFVIPASLSAPATAAWMGEMRCDAQARALLAGLH